MGAKAKASSSKSARTRPTIRSSAPPLAPSSGRFHPICARLLDVSRALFLSSKRLEQILGSFNRPDRFMVYQMLDNPAAAPSAPARLSEAAQIISAYIQPARRSLFRIEAEFLKAKSELARAGRGGGAAEDFRLVSKIDDIFSCHARVNAVVRNLSRLQDAILSGRLDSRQPLVRAEYAAQLSRWHEYDSKMAALLDIQESGSGSYRSASGYVAPLSAVMAPAGGDEEEEPPKNYVVPLSTLAGALYEKGKSPPSNYVVPLAKLEQAARLSQKAEKMAARHLAKPAATVRPSGLKARRAQTESFSVPVSRMPSSPAASGDGPGAAAEYASDLLDILSQSGPDIAERVLAISELKKLAAVHSRIPRALAQRLMQALLSIGKKDPNISLRIIANEASIAWSRAL